MKKLIFLVIVLMTSFKICSAQNISVSGIVIDALKNAPVKGVKIMFPGSDEVVATDSRGRYTIKNINPNSVLLFSCRRYKSKLINVSGNSTIALILERDTRFLEQTTSIDYFFCFHYGPPRDKNDSTSSDIKWIFN
ncbi:MAG: carboxypeptidase-like regulatory domain-containing protein [Bacteroidales bacterium]|nr:carboxypeptidase-like regulatory domain-containing protein [Bacteroidales bacterium]